MAKLQERSLKNLLARNVVNDEQVKPFQTGLKETSPPLMQMDMEDGEIDEKAEERD